MKTKDALYVAAFHRPFWLKKGLIYAPYTSLEDKERLIVLPTEVAYLGSCRAFEAISDKIAPFVLAAMGRKLPRERDAAGGH